MEILGWENRVIFIVIEWENPWKTIYKDLDSWDFPWIFHGHPPRESVTLDRIFMVQSTGYHEIGSKFQILLILDRI
jgi:hypothetical protein